MKYVCVMVLLASFTWGQSTVRSTTVLQQANSASGNTSAASASSSTSSTGKSGNTYSNDSGGIATGNSTSFAEIPSDSKTPKKVVVPSSLLGASSDAQVSKAAAANQVTGSETSLGDAARKSQTGTPEPSQLRFNDLVEGTDPAASTVRNFQSFANTHSMKETEQKVRQWAEDGKHIVATNVMEMHRKEQIPVVKAKLIELGFPKEWMEGNPEPPPPTE